MKDGELFALVLGEGEQIIKTYRPRAWRAYLTQILTWGFMLILAVLLGIGSGFDETGSFNCGFLIAYLTFFIFCAAICFILTALWCNKTVYAVTNKRVLIRTGHIGVDYKSLDFSMLGAMTVNVTWVDKLFRSNTGFIAFGSMSSPLTNQGAKFTFSFVQNPYELYKEIKAIIDSNKN